jgi:hypothetical protein
MTASAPLSPSLPPSVSPSSASRWTPDGDAHLIYQWVKFEGKTQSWVASAFGVNQSTISRVIQRYERWQAHAKERENGRLDHAERLRAQRWLTYERNELIAASCLRIAKELEGSIDASQSTILHHANDPTREIEVRTHHTTLDRTGQCSRFLRLAHRINMENLKLAAALEPPAAEPLSPEELAAEELQALADAAELAAARSSRHTPCAVAAEESGDGEQESRDSTPTERQSDGETEGDNLHDNAHSPSPPPSVSPSSAAPLHKTHNLHNEIPPQIAATTNQPCTCTLQARIEKNSPGICITQTCPLPDAAELGAAGAQAVSNSGSPVI